MSGYEKRGFVRKSARYPEAEQRRLLESKGVKVIYDNAETLDAALKSLRTGDSFYVTTLDRLANTRVELRNIVEEIHGRGALIIEVTTGRKSSVKADIAGMVFDAIDALSRDRRSPTPAQARARGKLGGRPRKAKLAYKQARMVWKDLKHYPLVEDAMMHMEGWSQKTAYRVFGKRGAEAGRKRKRK